MRVVLHLLFIKHVEQIQVILPHNCNPVSIFTMYLVIYAFGVILRPFHSHFWSLWWASRRGKQTLVENYGVKFSYNLGILPKLLSTMILSTPYVLFSSPYIFSVALFCFLSTWTSQKCLHLIRFVREGQRNTHIFFCCFFFIVAKLMFF